MIKNSEITMEDVTREVDIGVATADVQRGNSLEHLQTVRHAKATGLEKERDRLAGKYGDNHPRVAELVVKIETNRGLLRDLAVETVRARTETPSVDADSWILHGYVRDQELNGVAGLTVALYDEKAVWVERLGFACTKANGYFRLTAADIAGGDRSVFVRVLKNGTPLYADKSGLKPELGRVDYREIMLSDEIQVCTPPHGSAGPPIKPPDVPPTVPPDTPPKVPDTPPTVSPSTPPIKGPDTPPAVPPDTPSTGDPAAPQDAWVVRGRVTDESGEGLDGLTVSVYDRDLIFDDRLGDTRTDANGNFSLTYNAEDFRDLIERKPDIYLKVMNQKGNTVYSSEHSVRYEAGRVEIFEIKITADKVK